MNDGSGIGGGLITLFLYIVSKITLSDLASAATIISACTVIIVNMPKVVEVLRKYFKSKKVKKQ